MANNNNIFRPLVSSLYECIPLIGKGIVRAYDTMGNIAFRLIEGRPYGSVVVNTENISRYEYIPVEPILSMSKSENIVDFVFVEGEKNGIILAILFLDKHRLSKLLL